MQSDTRPAKRSVPEASSTSPLPKKAKTLHSVAQERYRITWDEHMGFSSRSVRYNKTSVLLLSWEEHYDDLEVKQEVDKLQHIFEELYGFRVYNKHIKEYSKSQKKPQLQCKKLLTDFVYEEDDENSLLIVYYAGHGFSDEMVRDRDIKLAGNLSHSGRTNETTKEVHEKNDIIWSKVEGAIQNIDSDVLLIFDCCQAGRLATRTRGAQHHNFEFLGSCSAHQNARSPGPRSFTSALIWALKELAQENSPFNTVRLEAKIVQHKPFPRDEQVPCLAFRDDLSNEHVVIARKSLVDVADKVPDRKAKQVEMEHKESIDIRLHFDSFVGEEVIVATAKELKCLIDDKSNHFHVKDIDFRGKVSLLERTASSFMQKARNVSTNRVTAPASVYAGGSALPSGDNSPAFVNEALSLSPDLTEEVPLRRPPVSM